MTPSAAEPAFEARWSPRATAVILSVWVAVCLALTAEPLAEHIAYFGERLGSVFAWAIGATLLGLCGWAALYLRLRERGLWRYEPRLLAGLAVAMVAWASPWALVVTALLFGLCYGAGSAALDRLGLTPPRPTARLGLAAAAGLGFLVLLLIPIGMAGLYSAGLFWVLTLAGCGLWRRRVAEIPALLRSLEEGWTDTVAAQSRLVGVAMAFLPAFVASFALAAVAPAISYDPVSHHMPAARHYLEGGRLEPLPVPAANFSEKWLFTLGHSVGYSYYPQSFEELLTFVWGLGGQPAAQLVAPLACALSLLLLIAVARLAGVSREACIVGAAAAFTLPFAHWTGAIAKNDYPLALFQLAALYAALTAKQAGRREWLVAGAFFMGLSVGVKHTAVFVSFPVGLLLLWELRRRAQPLRLAAAMAAVFLAAGFFWHVRAYVLTGNPFYPAGAARSVSTTPAIDGTTPSRWTTHLLYPWYLHFDGVKVMESPSGSPAGFYFLFFAPLWALYRRRQASANEAAVLFVLLVFYLYWAYIWGVLRYGLAPALLFAVLTADRLAAWAGQGRGSSRAARLTLGYCFAFALLPTLMLEVNAPQLAWYAKRLDREGYLRAAMADYPAIAFLNGRMGPEDRALSLNNCSSAYAVDPARFRCVRYEGVFEPDLEEKFVEIVGQSDPSYLVLPVNPMGGRVRRLLTGRFGPPIFEDGHFMVLEREER